jgi:hypothetical protein
MYKSIVNMIDRNEISEDLRSGQDVAIAARWILVAAGLMLALWSPTDLADLRVHIVVILGLAVANFYLHTQILMRKPVLAPVVYAASAADIVAISLIVIAGDGYLSPLFVFYLPAVLAISVAFRTEAVVAFTGAAILAYAMISATAFAGADGVAVATRMVIIAGVALCGNAYWRIERDRRRAAAETSPSVTTDVQAD